MQVSRHSAIRRDSSSRVQQSRFSSRRFSLRGLLYLSTATMAGISVGFHLWELESPVEREIRVHGATAVANKQVLLQKAYRLAELGAIVDQGGRIKGEVPELSIVEYAQLATHFRRQFPTESLQRRLRYERDGRMKKTLARKAFLQESTEFRLDELESPVQAIKWMGWPIRTEALYMLHSEDVFRLISQESAGFSRSPTPSINDLEPIEIPIIEFDAIPELGFERGARVAGRLVETPVTDRAAHDFFSERRKSLTDHELINQVLSDYFAWTRDANPMLMPTTDRLHELYLENLISFSQSGRNGYATAVDRVAGFRAHAISKKPVLRMREPRWTQYCGNDHQGNPIKPPEDRLWQLRSMQLVSLRKHAAPKVYADRAIPNMERVAEVPWRELDDFENDAVEQLYQGEDLVIRSHQNQVRMVGSMRTLTQCQTCHATERGDLLGAFTYDFVRVGKVSPMQLARN